MAVFEFKIFSPPYGGEYSGGDSVIIPIHVHTCTRSTQLRVTHRRRRKADSLKRKRQIGSRKNSIVPSAHIGQYGKEDEILRSNLQRENTASALPGMDTGRQLSCTCILPQSHVIRRSY